MNQNSIKILMPSIIDPIMHRGGAGTVTRSLLKILQADELNAKIEYIIPTSKLAKFHQLRQFTSIARASVSSLPSKAIFTYSKSFIKNIKQKIKEEEFDLILINGSDLLWLLSELPSNIPQVLIAHNIEHQLFEHQIKSINLPKILRSILLKDCARLQVYEMLGIEAVKNIICLSYSEEKFILKNCANLNTITIPPLFDYQPAKRSRIHKLDRIIELGFVGNFNWWPNQHGLNWFLENVFPYTKERVILHLFGEQSKQFDLSSDQIIKHGFVPNIQDVWSSIDLMICPIFLGGGVNIKFAEAAYNSVPILASSFAARGLLLKPDPSIVLLDTADEWISFLNSSQALMLRSQAIPATISNLFALNVYSESLQNFVKQAIKK